MSVSLRIVHPTFSTHLYTDKKRARWESSDSLLVSTMSSWLICPCRIIRYIALTLCHCHCRCCCCCCRGYYPQRNPADPAQRQGPGRQRQGKGRGQGRQGLGHGRRTQRQGFRHDNNDNNRSYPQ